MRNSKFIPPLLVALTFGLGAIAGHTQDAPGTAFVTQCKPGQVIPAHRHPGLALRAYAHFICGSSVYIWSAGTKTALVQQGSTVAYVASKYVAPTASSEERNPTDMRVFLQGIAEALQSRDASAITIRRQLVRSCLGSRGCEVEAWSDLAWRRIKRPNELAESADSTLRFLDRGIYYSAFVVTPPIRFKDQPLPTIGSPVLVLDGGGLNLAVAGRTCYTLGGDGKWAAAGVSTAPAVAAIQ